MKNLFLVVIRGPTEVLLVKHDSRHFALYTDDLGRRREFDQRCEVRQVAMKNILLVEQTLTKINLMHFR